MPADFSDPQRTSRAVLQSLRGWKLAGLTHLPRYSPPPPAIAPEVVATSATVKPIAEETASSPAAGRTATASSPTQPSSPPDSGERSLTESNNMPRSASVTASDKSLSLPQRQQRLADLAASVAACTRCRELAATRTQTVFGVGNPEARVMFIGEAPGADEDAQGEPFVGRAGQLMNKIIAACGWERGDLYICNILRCRPPGNRNPSDEEAANCREYLDGQIATIRPEYIVCWGSVAAKNLLNSEATIGKLRGQWYDYAGAKVLCTYHPSYLLRNPAAKKPVWEDMLLLLKEMGLKPPG